MRLSRINPDDALLFGSLILLALGAVLTVASTTGQPWLALGCGLIVFGLPSVLIALYAAAEE